MTRLPILLPILFVAACSANATAPAAPVANTNLLALTQADLTAAAAEATAGNDAEGAQCYTYLAGQLAVFQAGQAPGSAPVTVGVAYGFEAGRLALNNVSTAVNPASRTALEMACGPLAMSVVNQGAALVTEVSALAAMIAK